MCNLLIKKKWPQSFLSENYLDKTDLFLLKQRLCMHNTIIISAFDPLLLKIENDKN